MSEERITVDESVAVVGGGMMGIAAALRLAQAGFRVTLLEARESLGGLSGSFTWRDLTWDRFYHVVLTTDAQLLRFLRELGLEDKLFFCETQTGFYGEGRLVPFSSIKDFLLFPFMSLAQKVRLAFGILYASRIGNPTKLDRIYVRQWLTKVFGRRLYERIWDPLLRSKLGDARERTSAAFIWATIRRLYGARDSAEKQERMGHVEGGYRTVLDAAEGRLVELGVTVRTACAVSSVRSDPAGVIVVTEEGSQSFDKVLLTTPCPESLRILGDPTEEAYWRNLRAVDYLQVVCVGLVLSRRLSHYYVINLLEEGLPFTGIVEATNLFPSGSLDGRHLVYLPKYCTATDPINSLDDEETISRFLAGLRRVFPDLRPEEILHTRIERERYVQPLQELRFLERRLDYHTPLPHVYLVNTSMIENSTLNNNSVLTLSEAVCRAILHDASRDRSLMPASPPAQAVRGQGR